MDTPRAQKRTSGTAMLQSDWLHRFTSKLEASSYVLLAPSISVEDNIPKLATSISPSRIFKHLLDHAALPAGDVHEEPGCLSTGALGCLRRR